MRQDESDRPCPAIKVEENAPLRRRDRGVLLIFVRKKTCYNRIKPLCSERVGLEKALRLDLEFFPEKLLRDSTLSEQKEWPTIDDICLASIFEKVYRSDMGKLICQGLDHIFKYLLYTPLLVGGFGGGIFYITPPILP